MALQYLPGFAGFYTILHEFYTNLNKLDKLDKLDLCLGGLRLRQPYAATALYVKTSLTIPPTLTNLWESVILHLAKINTYV